MLRPLLRAEAIILNNDKTKLLVQCDLQESFYRLPGGSVEYCETGVKAIKREMLEEYDLHIIVGELACINENIIEYKGEKIHNCTLIHWCCIPTNFEDFLLHKEKPHEVKLIWRTIEELKLKPTYPEGILDIITSDKKEIVHIFREKIYD